jgi:hypothetical protein
MYDPKFERSVRQKMEDLRFSPSESVWANIEKAVMGGRKRRGGAYVRRLMLPLLLLSGAAGAFYFAAKKPGVRSETAVSHAALSHAQAGSSTKATGTTASATRNSTSRVATNKTSADETSINQNSANHTPADRALRSAPTGSAPATDAGAGVDQTNQQENAVSAAYVPAVYLFRPTLVRQGAAGAVKASRLTNKKATISVNAIQRARRPWEAGFIAGGGISRLNKLDVSESGGNPGSLFFSAYASNANYAGKHFISDVRPDASYYAGIHLEKPISDRWAFSTGLTLHYYSNRITTGQQVPTYVPATYSLITPTTVPAALQTTPIYAAGDENVVTNKYYFLELPVGMRWKMNRSPILPIFLEGGASLSRLMGSNALFYDPSSGVYLKDGQVLQKTALNVFGSLTVGLPFHGVRIQAGPEVQYGLTPLINNESLGNQHFLYGGIRMVVLPGRM